MLAKNSERTLTASLQSTQSFEEVLLLDTGSTDQTISIAKSFSNVKCLEAPFTGFGELRNRLAERAQFDWILALDSDEILSPSLLQEIQTLSLNPSCAYDIPFENYYNQKRIIGCGWHPESHIRLYHRKKTRFSSHMVHEGIEINSLNILKLNHSILHTPYLEISDFLKKMQLYTDLFAENHQGKRKASFATALGHAIAAFFKSYFLKKGLFCGREGFIISSYNAITTYYKYLKLCEINKNL